MLAAGAVTIASMAVLTVSAAPAQADGSCHDAQQSADGHKFSWICGGSGTQYRTTATFCGTSTCRTTTGPWVSNGTRQTLTSGGYFAGGLHVDFR